MDDLPLDQLSREALEDLIESLELDVTVDDLITALAIAAKSDDLDALRAAIDQMSKAA